MARSERQRRMGRVRIGGPLSWVAVAALLPALVLIGGALAPARGAGAECARVQALVGGHGLGAVTVAAWCTFTFDPRSEPLCSCPAWPLPGGACFCPDHAASVAPLEEPISSARVPVLVPRRREGATR